MAPRKDPLKPGDPVEWNTPQGKTTGKVTRKVTHTEKVQGHTARATASEPEFEVRSDKSGRTAIHRPQSLRPIKGGGDGR